MENRDDESMKKFIREALMENPLSSASPEFTDRVMARIQTSNKVKVMPDHPLIQKWIWAIVLFVLVGVTFISNKPHGLPDWLTTTYFDQFNQFFLNINWNEFMLGIPRTIVYGLISLGSWMLVQILWFRNYYNRKLDRHKVL